MDNKVSYERTVSASDCGFAFELKMTALMAMRLYNYSQEFNLANNFKHGDKFDDLVFSAKFSGDWETWFIQLKHKQKDSVLKRKVTLASLNSKTKANNNDYNVVEYFYSYKEICRQFRPDSDKSIFRHSLDKAHFILFTNALLGDDVVKREYQPQQVPLLNTFKQHEKNIQLHVKKDAILFGKISEKVQLDAFLSNFYLCCSKASEDELDNVINFEIRHNNQNLTQSQVDFVRGQLYDYIRKWYKEERFLTKDDVHLLISESYLSQTQSKSLTDITFTKTFLRDFHKTIQSAPIVFLSVNAEHTRLAMVTLAQLQLLDAPNYKIVLSQFEKTYDNIVSVSQQNKDMTLVLECDEMISQEYAKKLSSLLKNLNLKQPTRLILVASKDNIHVAIVAQLIGAKKCKYNFNLSCLDEDSKCMIASKPVSFQGYETSLNSILPVKVFQTLITTQFISKLYEGEKPLIGVQPSPSIPYYVTRVLNRHFINNKIIELCENGHILAVSNLTVDQASLIFPNCCIGTAASLSKNDAKIFVINGNKEFEFLAKKFVNVHWLERVGKRWVWKCSTGNVADCLKYQADNLQYVKTDNIMNISDRVACVIAEPGMGKSTLLMHIAEQTKKKNPHLWVVFVTLNDYTDKLASNDFMTNLKTNVKGILLDAAEICGEVNKFDETLFNHFYDKSGDLIVLLDGFDEISPYYTEQGLAIIHTLLNSPIKRIWVTARPTMLDILQKNMNTYPFTLKRFEDNDQKTFLTKFWEHTVQGIAPEKLREFIERIIALVKESFEDEFDEFTGIPLQTRMIAEIFENDLRRFHENGILELPDSINRLVLFETFVMKKLNIIDVKSKIVSTNASLRHNIDLVKTAQEERLMKLALLALLTYNECASLKPAILQYQVNELKDEVNNGAEKSGIVVTFRGEVPHFIHRSFAEYYAARFLVKHFKENLDFIKSETFKSSSFKCVRYFIDRMSAKDMAIHSAVLDGDLDKLEISLKGNVDLNEMDAIGRTPLHLSASIPNSECKIKMLLKAGADPHKLDSVFEWTPWQFAFLTKDAGNIGPLLEVMNATVPRGIVENSCATFAKAFQGDYMQLFLSLLEQGITSVVGFELLPLYSWIDETLRDDLTYLHLAAAHNSSKILHYLLRNDTRDSKLFLLERKDKSGYTPLFTAARYGNLEALSLLTNAGAKWDDVNYDAINIFDLALLGRNTQVLISCLSKFYKGNSDIKDKLTGVLTSLVGERSEWSYQTLLSVMAAFPELSECKTKKGLSLLEHAVIKNNFVAFKVLIEIGIADHSALSSLNGCPLLHLAVERKCCEIVTIIVESGRFPIDLKNEDGKTALFLATMDGDVQIMSLLIEHGAKLDCTDEKGNTLEQAAEMSGNKSAQLLLQKKGFILKSFRDTFENGKPTTSSPSLLQAMSSTYNEPSTDCITGNMSRLNVEAGDAITSNNKSKKKKRGRKSVAAKDDSNSVMQLLDSLRGKLDDEKATCLLDLLKKVAAAGNGNVEQPLKDASKAKSTKNKNKQKSKNKAANKAKLNVECKGDNQPKGPRQPRPENAVRNNAPNQCTFNPPSNSKGYQMNGPQNAFPNNYGNQQFVNQTAPNKGHHQQGPQNYLTFNPPQIAEGFRMHGPLNAFPYNYQNQANFNPSPSFADCYQNQNLLNQRALNAGYLPPIFNPPPLAQSNRPPVPGNFQNKAVANSAPQAESCRPPGPQNSKKNKPKPCPSNTEGRMPEKHSPSQSSLNVNPQASAKKGPAQKQPKQKKEKAPKNPSPNATSSK